MPSAHRKISRCKTHRSAPQTFDGPQSSLMQLPVGAGIYWKVGEWLEARDFLGHWHPAKIIRVESNHVRVHFHGWSKRFDENKSYDDLRPLKRGKSAHEEEQEPRNSSKKSKEDLPSLHSNSGGEPPAKKRNVNTKLTVESNIAATTAASGPVNGTEAEKKASTSSANRSSVKSACNKTIIKEKEDEFSSDWSSEDEESSNVTRPAGARRAPGVRVSLIRQKIDDFLRSHDSSGEEEDKDKEVSVSRLVDQGKTSTSAEAQDKTQTAPARTLPPASRLQQKKDLPSLNVINVTHRTQSQNQKRKHHLTECSVLLERLPAVHSQATSGPRDGAGTVQVARRARLGEAGAAGVGEPAGEQAELPAGHHRRQTDPRPGRGQGQEDEGQGHGDSDVNPETEQLTAVSKSGRRIQPPLKFRGDKKEFFCEHLGLRETRIQQVPGLEKTQEEAKSPAGLESGSKRGVGEPAGEQTELPAGHHRRQTNPRPGRGQGQGDGGQGQGQGDGGQPGNHQSDPDASTVTIRKLKRQIEELQQQLAANNKSQVREREGQLQEIIKCQAEDRVARATERRDRAESELSQATLELSRAIVDRDLVISKLS